MPDYRRLRIAGGSYFFTVNLADRRSCLLTNRVEDLRHAVRRVRTLAPFHIDARVILPDHMHAVWTLPEGDHDFPRRQYPRGGRIIHFYHVFRMPDFDRERNGWFETTNGKIEQPIISEARPSWLGLRQRPLGIVKQDILLVFRSGKNA